MTDDAIEVGGYVTLDPDDGCAYEVLAIEGDTVTLDADDEEGGTFNRPITTLVPHLSKAATDRLVALLNSLNPYNEDDYIEVQRPE